MAYGLLEVHAYADSTEVAATVKVGTIGEWSTPFSASLPPGQYVLVGEYKGQTQVKIAEITEGKTTYINFYFEEPPLISISSFTAIISAVSLLLTVYTIFFMKPKTLPPS